MPADSRDVSHVVTPGVPVMPWGGGGGAIIISDAGVLAWLPKHQIVIHGGIVLSS